MSAELDALTLKVQRLLADMVSDVRVDRDGSFLVPYGSTMVNVEPLEQESGRLLVRVQAYMNQNVPVSPALFEWVARKTDDYVFGHIGLWDSKSSDKVHLVFRHTLLGSTLDPDELGYALGAVATTADELDDEVQSTFGGERFADPAAS